MNTTNHTRAIDLPSERRPGVPAQHEPVPVGAAHWAAPERQAPRPELTIDAQRREPTATFGTGQPPRGLSGLMRRAAYRMPDYKPRRWMLLLLADRVDAIEDRAMGTPNRATWIGRVAKVGAVVAGRLIPPRGASFR